MSEALPGHAIDGVQVWPSEDDASLFRYVPGAPRLDRLPDGKPALGVIAVGSGGILQATWRWSLDDAEKAALAAALARSETGIDPDRLQFLPAEMEIQEAVLEIAAADGSWIRVAAGRPSGPPSFVTALSGRVDQAGRQAVEAVLAGAKNRMRLRISGHVGIMHWAEARITGDAADLVAGLPVDADDAAALAAVDRGIGDGLLTQNDTASPDAPEDLLLEARQAARQRAAELLLAMRSDNVPPPEPGAPWPGHRGLSAVDPPQRLAQLEAAIRLTRPAQVPLERSGDAAGTN